MIATTGYRRTTSETRPVRHLLFHRLPAGIRRSLGHSLARGGVPRPLLSATRGPRPPSARTWAFLALGAVLVDLGMWLYGFGDRLEDPALSPEVLAALHTLVLATALFAALRAWRIKNQYLGVPYPAGRHLFELDLVEVDGVHVRVTPLDALKRVEARPGAGAPVIAAVFTDGHEVLFDSPDTAPDAEAQARAAQSAIDAGRRMTLPDDLAHLEKVDPFLELRIGNDWTLAEAGGAPEASPHSPARSFIERIPTWVIGAVAGLAGLLAGAGALAAGRSHKSALDDARFEEAHGKADLLEQYIAQGGKHTAAAEDELFDIRKIDDAELAKYIARGGPRGDLAEQLLFERQKQGGDVEGLTEQIKRGGRYAVEADDILFDMAKRSHSSTAVAHYLERGHRHAAEVTSVLLPEFLFEEAQKTGLPAPLLTYADQYPDSPRAAEAKAAAHAVYVNALKAYLERESPPAASRRFMEAMFASVEARNDPSVVVSVRADLGPILDADRLEGTDRQYQPAAPHLRDIRARVSGELDEWLWRAFPKGLLQPMIPEADPEGTLPRFEVVVTPIVREVITAETPGAEALGSDPKLRFANIQLKIEFRASLPGRPERITWSAETKNHGLDGFKVKVRVEAKVTKDAKIQTDWRDSAPKVYGLVLDDLTRVVREQLAEKL